MPVPHYARDVVFAAAAVVVVVVMAVVVVVGAAAVVELGGVGAVAVMMPVGVAWEK